MDGLFEDAYVKSPADPFLATREKITSEGQPCRHCQTPVTLVVRTKPPARKRCYYFSRWFSCPKCHATYFDPKNRVDVGECPAQTKFWPKRDHGRVEMVAVTFVPQDAGDDGIPPWE